MNIKAVVMCHNHPESSERIAKQLDGVFDVTIIDSGSDKDKQPHGPNVLRFPNIYWTGCWNKAIELCGDEFDALWVLGGDVELKNTAAEYKEAMESAMPFGCWSPCIEGQSRPLMARDKAKDGLWHVWHIEGVALALSRKGINQIGRLIEGNLLGWGVDVWMNWMCWRAGMKNILDGRVHFHHPHGTGYSSQKAKDEMETFFLKEFGSEWRTIFRFWRDEFEINVIELLTHTQKICQVSVILASYNQRKTIEMVMETLYFQDFLPMEVVVADDGSSDGTLEWLDSIGGHYPFPVKYVTRNHEGYDLAGVNNLAAAKASGGRLLLTNSDVLHCPYSVGSHASLPSNQIGGGFVSGISLPASDEVTLDDVRMFQKIEGLSKMHPPDMTNQQWFGKDPMQNFYGFWGGNYSIPKKLFEEVGGFNSGYKLHYGGEEADFIQRACRRGGSLGWAEKSKSYHLEHTPRTYRNRALGNVKYRKEYLS